MGARIVTDESELGMSLYEIHSSRKWIQVFDGITNQRYRVVRHEMPDEYFDDLKVFEEATLESLPSSVRVVPCSATTLAGVKRWRELSDLPVKVHIDITFTNHIPKVFYPQIDGHELTASLVGWTRILCKQKASVLSGGTKPKFCEQMEVVEIATYCVGQD